MPVIIFKFSAGLGGKKVYEQLFERVRQDFIVRYADSVEFWAGGTEAGKQAGLLPEERAISLHTREPYTIWSYKRDYERLRAYPEVDVDSIRLGSASPPESRE